MIRTDLTASGAYAGVREFLQRSARPPAGLVVGTFGQAHAALRAVTDSGLDVPGDVRVVGFDRAENDYGQFLITAAQQPVDTITRRALSRLLDESADELPADEPIAATLSIGNTCGCATDAATPAPSPTG